MARATVIDRAGGLARMIPVFLKWLVPTALTAVSLIVFASAWASVLSYHVWIVAALASGRMPSSQRASTAPGPWRARALAALLIVMPPIAVASAILFDRYQQFPDLTGAIGGIGLIDRSVLPFALYLCVFNGVLEELYWRKKGPPVGRHAWVNDALYALFHSPVIFPYMPLGIALASLPALFAAGLAWRASIATFRGRIWPAIASHVGCNVAIWLWLVTRQ